MSTLTVVILTFNEELHIARCIESANQVADHVIVVDSFSTDRTLTIARERGCATLQHEFTTQAAQLQWALETIEVGTAWLMRIDADEIISPTLADAIREGIRTAQSDVTGFIVSRSVKFQRAHIKHGGFPQHQLKIWRPGCAAVEQRLMDEHMVLLRGRATRLPGEYVDDNLHGITWWTTKHNAYATREAIGLLNSKYKFRPVAGLPAGLPFQAKYKRWIKDNVYWRLPPTLRAGLFFTYRMIPQLGILDGARGFPFHLLQGYWYRMLVDLKVREVEQCMHDEGLGCTDAIQRALNVDPLK